MAKMRKTIPSADKDAECLKLSTSCYIQYISQLQRWVKEGDTKGHKEWLLSCKVLKPVQLVVGGSCKNGC